MFSQLCLKILILVTIFRPCLQRAVNISQADDHRIVYPRTMVTSTGCNATMVCKPLSSCNTFESGQGITIAPHNKQTYPKICGWEISEPLVCCISTAVQQPQMKTQQNSLSKEECAVQKPDSVPVKEPGVSGIFVVDGSDVNSNDKYPFIVGVYIKLGEDKLFLCGGSLLSKGMVLTAAHCFDNRIETDTYVLRMGSINLQPNLDFSSDFEFNVIEVIIHPDYRTPQLYHDIAILKFTGLESYTDTVRPICLPDSSVDVPIASVIGWGSKEFGGSSSAILQEASIPIVHNTECNSVFQPIGTTRVSLPTGVVSSIICAGENNSSKDACQGDSGGPLVFADTTLRWTQVGIVSGGIGCGTPGIPGIYTRVSNYVEWIHSKS